MGYRYRYIDIDEDIDIDSDMAVAMNWVSSKRASNKGSFTGVWG